MLIDSHCHIPHKRYEVIVDEVINQAKEVGVAKLINVGTSILENKKVLEVSGRYENVYSTVGIYPHEEIGKSIEELSLSLEGNLNSSKKIVAIGECGIDVSDLGGGRNLEEQKKIFEMQVNLAISSGLPLMIHNRNGDDTVLEILNKYKDKKLRGIAHCFSSTWEVAQKFLDLGFYLSFSGMITYPSRKDLFEIVQKVPDNRIVFETDAPYLPPQGHRGEVNYPKYVKIVAEKASQIKQKPFEETSRMSFENTCRIFNL